MKHRNPVSTLARFVAVTLGFALPLGAQERGVVDPAVGSTAQTYRTPPPAMAALVDQPLTPAVSVSPDGAEMLLLEVPGLFSIADLAEPELRLAGLRINPRNNGPSRSRYFTALTLESTADGAKRPVTGLPGHPRIANVRWSPDGRFIGFTLAREGAIELWAAEVESGAARVVAELRLNDAYGAPYAWLPDSEGFVVRLVPADRGEPPEEPAVPEGPVIQESSGHRAPARTYQDLLKRPHDKALFEHYLTARVARVTLDGRVEELGEPGLVIRAEPSPNGGYLLVETLHRPLSYLVPLSRFPRRIEVWDRDGHPVHLLADLPLAEEVPIAFDAVRSGPRAVAWRADVPATLAWVEAQDGGDPSSPTEVRDRLYTLSAPFTAAPVPVIDLGLRFAGVQWGTESVALVSERWWKNRRVRTWAVRPGTASGDPEAAAEPPRLLFDRSMEDRYADPGQPLMRTTPAGTRVMRMDRSGRYVFLRGRGASPEGNRPFLDRLDLASGEVRRLWRSEAPTYEWPVDLLDARRGVLLTTRESVTEPPNYFVRNLRSGKLVRLTDFPHPTPELATVQKELIRYEREDGVQLSATLYLPPGYEPGDDPLPTLVWAYPREYKDAKLAGQITDSPYRFVRVSYWGALPMLAQGWAVLDDPSMPIIGVGEEEPNDTYVQQLVASARAAVEEAARRGVTDPGRVAIGGHSYGAFMTANLLAHSDLFRAGIARSGAYNRTLTPFGFQAEERTFWEAPEVYFAMSPFMHAEDVNEPILLIHGEADNNSGTFPIQSDRFYHALKGLGATVRLVKLPHESHGYRARESILHMLWEEYEWLHRFVESPPGRHAAGEER
ncbi:MAG: S9 family peptidase [Gemmatimonadota bacterium]